MENIQHAVLSAIESKPLEFKKYIEDEINNRVYSVMQARKQELAKNILNPSDDSSEEESEEDITPEEHDEEL
jgi:hypothetical protein